jgi:hypothetical protein
MASLHTPPVNEYLVEYNKLYSEYLGMIVELHNYHTRYLEFVKIRKERPGGNLRKHLKKMNEILKRLHKITIPAEREQVKLFPPMKGTPVRSTNPIQMAKPGKTKKHVVVPGTDSRRVTR